jgi:hypothetical protein
MSLWGPVSKSDERYYARMKELDQRKRASRIVREKRAVAYKEWLKLHPEGLTGDNLKEFQGYIRSMER